MEKYIVTTQAWTCHWVWMVGEQVKAGSAPLAVGADKEVDAKVTIPHLLLSQVAADANKLLILT